ncbi:hypothetical protein D018_0136B, partial [Vibrio parahaemolyticus VP2007-007]
PVHKLLAKVLVSGLSVLT